MLADGAVSFARRISTEADYDFLRFYVDSVELGAWSGTEAWAEVSYPITSGKHHMQWTYAKDDLIAEGSDAVFIDQILLPPFQQIVATFEGEDPGVSATLAPNPTLQTSVLRYDLKPGSDLNIDLFDAFGKYLSPLRSSNTGSASEGQVTIDLTRYPSGVYFVRLQTEQGIVVQRLIKN